MDVVENIEAYHDVFAESLRSLVNQIANGNMENAEHICEYNIRYAYTLLRTEQLADLKSILKELDAMDFKKMTFNEKLVTMVHYQTQAGLKPTQRIRRRADVYGRIAGMI